MSRLRELLDAATPGDWLVDRTEDSLDVRGEHAVATIWIHLAGGMTLADDAIAQVRERALADARLIAMAPDMARLLVDLYDEFHAGFQWCDPECGYCKDCERQTALWLRLRELGERA